MTKIAYVHRVSDEWTAMWRGLASSHDVNVADEETGERWQYMGSHDDGDGWMHGFRHRSLKGERVYRDVTASHGWAPDEVTEFDFETIPF